MANAEEVNRIIERAKAGGVDMSWLKAPQVQATGGVGRISPGASQLMDAVRQAQAVTPVYMPFPGGTPTQRRREADESTRQVDVGQKFSREQWDWQKGFQERQFAADQAYRNAQLALSRAAASAGAGGGAAGLTGMFNTLGTQTERQQAAAANYQRIVQNAIAGGESLEVIAKDIVDASPEMQADGINPADMLRFAVGHFGQQYGTQQYQPGMKTDIKWFQNYKWYRDNMNKVMEQAEALDRQFRPAGPVTGAEYLTPAERQRIAEIIGIPVEDVDLYIKANPGLIGQLLGKQHGAGGYENWMP